MPELVAVVGVPKDDLSRIPPAGDALVVAFDRPASPGNLGTRIRSADVFGASGVVVSGHAADPYDPRAVRASTGSLFALPVVRSDGHRGVVESARAAGLQLLGTDQRGEVELGDADLTGPVLLAIGNETVG